MLRRFLFLPALAVLLAGCVTASNTLSPDQISSFRLQAVEVTVAPNAFVSWMDELDLPPEGTEGRPASSQAEAGVRTRQAIVAKLRDSMLKEVGGELNGARPVKLLVRVHEFVVTPGAVRILIGGDHRIKADVDIVDAKTGALLLAFPAHGAFIQGGGGLMGVALDNMFLDDPANRIVRHYVLQYRNWLLRK